MLLLLILVRRRDVWQSAALLGEEEGELLCSLNLVVETDGVTPFLQRNASEILDKYFLLKGGGRSMMCRSIAISVLS